MDAAKGANPNLLSNKIFGREADALAMRQQKKNVFTNTSAADIIKKLNVKYYDAVESGLKSFEIRLEDDCKYEVGKTIRFDEYDEEKPIVESKNSEEVSSISEKFKRFFVPYNTPCSCSIHS